MKKYIPNRYAGLLLLFSFGSPGLLAYDTNNLNLVSGFNIDKVIETAVFTFTVFALGMFYLIENKNIRAKIFSFELFSYSFFLLTLYLFYLLTVTHQVSTVQYLEISFRIFEWIICILLAQSTVVSLLKISDYAERMDLLRRYTFIFCLTPILMATCGFILGIESSLFRYNTGTFRFGGQFFNPIYLSYFSILCIGIMISEKKLNIIRILLIMSLFIVIYFTKTRQSLFTVITFIGLIAIASKITNSKNLLGRVTLIFLTISAVLTVLFFADLIFMYAARNGDITELLTLNNRTILWQSFTTNTKITFWGDGFIISGQQFGEKVLHITGHWKPTHPHNELMNLYLSGGILGSLIGILIYGKMLINFCTFFYQDNFPKYILLGIFSILIFQAVTPLFSHTLNIFGCFAALTLISVSNYKLISTNKESQ